MLFLGEELEIWFIMIYFDVVQDLLYDIKCGEFLQPWGRMGTVESGKDPHAGACIKGSDDIIQPLTHICQLSQQVLSVPASW